MACSSLQLHSDMEGTPPQAKQRYTVHSATAGPPSRQEGRPVSAGGHCHKSTVTFAAGRRFYSAPPQKKKKQPNNKQTTTTKNKKTHTHTKTTPLQQQKFHPCLQLRKNRSEAAKVQVVFAAPNLFCRVLRARKAFIFVAVKKLSSSL